jgi:hypothetical protein
MAQSKSWKDAERRTAGILGGTRINGARGVQMQDVEHGVFSVEVKHGKTCIPKFVSDAYEQARRNAPKGKIPLVVLHKQGSAQYMAVLPLVELVKFLEGRDAAAASQVFQLVLELDCE